MTPKILIIIDHHLPVLFKTCSSVCVGGGCVGSNEVGRLALCTGTVNGPYNSPLLQII